MQAAIMYADVHIILGETSEFKGRGHGIRFGVFMEVHPVEVTLISEKCGQKLRHALALEFEQRHERRCHGAEG